MMRNPSILKALALLFFGLTIVSLAWANGEDFFTPHGGQGFYYFGHVKDTNGKVLDDVTININVKYTVLKFRVRNDTPGHFRTPTMVELLGSSIGQNFNPGQIEVTATKPGYRQVSPTTTTVSNKTSGGLPIDFIMEQNK